MSRIVIASVLLALAPAVAVAGRGAAGQKHSGVIVDVSPGPRTITVDEMGAWTRAALREVRRTLEITPSTRIELVARDAAAGAGGWPGGFKDSPLALSDLRRGDFATVTAEPRDGRLVASSIAVVRPRSTR